MILNSRDGQWIYFYSGRDKGTYQLWKAPFKRHRRSGDEQWWYQCDRIR